MKLEHGRKTFPSSKYEHVGKNFNQLSEGKRIVTTSKYEFKDRDLKKKWEEIFKKCENPDQPSLDRRSSVVYGLLPNELYESVAEILNLQPLWKLEPEQYLETKEGREEEEILAEGSTISEEYIDEVLSSDLYVECSSIKKTEPPVEDNPYLKFLKKPEHRAASWRPKEEFVRPPGMPISVAASIPLRGGLKRTLSEKANVITNYMIKYICEFIEGMGGFEKSEMTEDVLQELFEIAYSGPDAKYLCVRVKELLALQESVAKKLRMPESSIRATLHREILRDVRAEEKSQERLVAFGTALQPPLRHVLPKNNTRWKWLDCLKSRKTMYRDLKSMKPVFEGITDLCVTKVYCKWLLEHPENPRPKYLEQMGMFDTIPRQYREDFSSLEEEGTDVTSKRQCLARTPQITLPEWVVEALTSSKLV